MATAGASAPQEGKQHSRRQRRKVKAASADEDLSAEEKLRRQHQRKRREIAFKVRAEGKEYKKQRLNASLKKPAQQQQQPTARPSRAIALQADDPGTRPDHAVQVIVVPIFWNKRIHEKKEVLEAADSVSELLNGAGIDSGCDTTVTLSPGQKFRHWEEQGVFVRVELGPKEAVAGTCLLAICTTPGEVASKSIVRVGQPLLEAVRLALKLPAGSKEADAAVVKKLGLQKRAASGNPRQHTTFSDADEPSQPAAEIAAGGGRLAAGPRSGDDLGDFDDLLAEDVGGQPSKAKRKKPSRGKMVDF